MITTQNLGSAGGNYTVQVPRSDVKMSFQNISPYNVTVSFRSSGYADVSIPPHGTIKGVTVPAAQYSNYVTWNGALFVSASFPAGTSQKNPIDTTLIIYSCGINETIPDQGLIDNPNVSNILLHPTHPIQFNYTFTGSAGKTITITPDPFGKTLFIQGFSLIIDIPSAHTSITCTMDGLNGGGGATSLQYLCPQVTGQPFILLEKFLPEIPQKDLSTNVDFFIPSNASGGNGSISIFGYLQQYY